jgi:hypothetical protein
MPTYVKALQPTAALLNLAGLVKAHPKLTPGAGINFHLNPQPDGSTEIGMVYSFGDRRDSRTTPPVCEDDVETIVQSINEWIERIPPTDKWTEDLHEADSLNWPE